MNWIKTKISDLKPNKDNPRTIKDDKFKKLVASVKSFPEMLEIRPIVINKEMTVIGGNQRFKACIEAGFTEVPTIMVDNLTQEQEREFIIKDNVQSGEWEWLIIEDWEGKENFKSWGFDVKEHRETERLSELKYESIYFEPKEKPDLKLMDCLNTDKFLKKIEAINLMDLNDDQKKVLQFFAYRFIKIDFENVANYYSFIASDEEKKAIERLRLVLVDNGSINGFIEDDLLRVNSELIIDEEND